MFAAPTARAALIGAICTVLLATGCATDGQHPPGLAAMISRVAPAVVTLADDTQTLASGFFAAPNWLVTNHHVAQAGRLFVSTQRAPVIWSICLRAIPNATLQFSNPLDSPQARR